ncbi:MAG: hypothetical protein OXI26_04835 [bacterium]|nr:hypothetical protein [bacterium]
MISPEKREVQHWLDSLRGADDPDAERPGGNRSWLPKNRTGAGVAVAALVVMAGFWIWAFSPLAPSGHPDVLHDVVFTLDAEDICARSVTEADRLPTAAEATGPEDRATQLTAATRLFAAMVNDLRDRAAEVVGSDRELVDAWLVDWQTYLDNRVDYAVTLAGGSDPPFTVTARDGDGVDSYIDIFAEVNSMPSCATPGDV